MKWFVKWKTVDSVLVVALLAFTFSAWAALEGVDTRSGNQSSVNLSGGGLQTGFPPRAIAVTPLDATTFTQPSTIYVGGAGTVIVEPLLGGNTVTFIVPAGGVVPVVVKRVLTASTATNMVRLY